MRCCLFFLFIFLAKSSWAELLLVDKVPFCGDIPYVIKDIDKDGQPETICMKQIPIKNEKGVVYGVFLNLTKKTDSVRIAVVLLTEMKKPVYAHDDFIESVNLEKYKSKKPGLSSSGFGIRLVYPEKSSFLYYWDENKDVLVKLQESD